MKKLIGIVLFFLLCGGIAYYYLNNKKENKFIINVDNELFAEVNSSRHLREFVSIENGELLNGDELIDTSSTGIVDIEAEILDLNNKKAKKIVSINVNDTIPPEVNGVKDITITAGDKVDFYKNLEISDNSNGQISKEIVGSYDTSKSGTYNLSYLIKDESDNETKKDFKLIVNAKKTTTVSSSKYYIKVNKTMNVVMVYTKDDSSEYTKLVKTFLCSAGKNTPIGTFKTGSKYATLALVGGVYGHYTVQIKGPFWFHSVPYYKKADSSGNWTTLEYEEFNKLGSLASKGCVRLAVIDSKWIYDNIPKGTTVEIYESDSLPSGVIKPEGIKIDTNDELRRGWDPTDPDPDNPWK